MTTPNNALIPMETRREAYEAMDKPARRAEILAVWEGVMIPQDVVDRLPYKHVTAVRPRISEMKKAGLLEVVETRKDRNTGFPCAAYRLTESGQAMKWKVMHGAEDSTEGQAFA